MNLKNKIYQKILKRYIFNNLTKYSGWRYCGIGEISFENDFLFIEIFLNSIEGTKSAFVIISEQGNHAYIPPEKLKKSFEYKLNRMKVYGFYSSKLINIYNICRGVF